MGTRAAARGGRRLRTSGVQRTSEILDQYSRINILIYFQQPSRQSSRADFLVVLLDYHNLRLTPFELHRNFPGKDSWGNFNEAVSSTSTRRDFAPGAGLGVGGGLSRKTNEPSECV
jgi:hypothetical protein